MNIYYIGSIPVSDELYHHGILGQKWGVRRFQNPDGTLTPAGRKRYYGISESTDTSGSGGTSRANYKVGNTTSGTQSNRVQTSKPFSERHWKKSTKSMNECHHAAWKYCFDKGSKGNKKAVDKAMKDGGETTKAIETLAKDFYAKSKVDVDKYVKYTKEIANSLHVDPNSNRMEKLLRQKYPDYVKTESETQEARKRVLKSINDSVENGTFDSVFKGYPPISYKDDGYGPKRNISRVVDGRKAVIASYIDHEYFFNNPEYKAYGFQYFTPEDFVEYRNTKTGEKVK